MRPDFPGTPRGQPSPETNPIRPPFHLLTNCATGPCQVRRNLNDTERNVIDIAGWVAEALYLNDPAPWEGQWYDAFDRARAGLHGFCDECRIASRLVSARPKASSGELLIAVRCIAGITRGLLRSHWESVERIAHALLAVGWLDNAECRGLVGADLIEGIPGAQWVPVTAPSKRGCVAWSFASSSPFSQGQQS
jgi:hypothetical protein